MGLVRERALLPWWAFSEAEMMDFDALKGESFKREDVTAFMIGFLKAVLVSIPNDTESKRKYQIAVLF